MSSATAAALPVPVKSYSPPPRRKRNAPVPDYLVREVIDGVRYYYKGYKSVLSGKKQASEIMGSSGIQSLIVTCLTGILFNRLNRKKYWLFTNEVGGHLDNRNNPAFDFAIFEKSIVKPSAINFNYLQFAPKIAIEVDTEVETEEGISDQEYIYKKTSNLFRFGTERVIWIFTRTRQVVVINALDDWRTFPWHTDIEVLDGVTFNIGRYLDEEGVNLDAAI
jgi:Uma2 family endonuclease